VDVPFLLTIVFVFLTISVESLMLALQLGGRKLTRWFGEKAFTVHALVTVCFWVVTSCLLLALQFHDHPSLHGIPALRYVGIGLLVVGAAVALWAFVLLGPRRSLCLNFFEKGVPTVTRSLYKYLRNPMDLGMCVALAGLAAATDSIYNLIVGLEFIALMIPHAMLENRPFRG
jgi:protein-S-isoprenylcysteine O-methyltransferase Ste14